MPELPEVETIRRQMLSLRTTQISKAHLLWPKSCPTVPEVLFSDLSVGRSFLDFGRRGKYLIGDLEGLYLIIHFGMTGSLVRGNMAPPHTRAFWELSNGETIFFNDPRKFGRIWLCTDPNVVLGKLGVEPLEEGFSLDFFCRMLKKSSLPIKSLLLTQDQVCGIGNMYADEALFLSGILPQTISRTLAEKQAEKLHQGIRSVLQSGIAYQGATVSDYKMPDGTSGRAQEYFFVAHRHKQSCKLCGQGIVRTVIAGRGTYFCPNCQR